MGYDLKRIQIELSVSRHNSDQDLVDDQLVRELTGRINAILCEPRYESLLIDVWLPS